MTTVFQPPPTWAMTIELDRVTGVPTFNPVWLTWFVKLAEQSPSSEALSVTIVTAPLTGGGTPGSMTFVRGALVSQVPAT